MVATFIWSCVSLWRSSYTLVDRDWPAYRGVFFLLSFFLDILRVYVRTYIFHLQLRDDGELYVIFVDESLS